MKPSLFFNLMMVDDFILIVVIFLFGVTFVIFGSLLRFRQQRARHHLAVQKRINYYLVYRVNLKLDIVYEFDPKHPQADKVIPVSTFLKSFSPLEAEKLYQWWEKLLHAKMDTPWIYSTKMSRQKKEKNRQMIFEVIKIDENHQSIHLHRYGLNYLKPNPKKFANKQIVISSQQALTLIKKLPAKQGVIFSLHMIFPRAGLDEQFKFFYLSQIKEKILPFLSPQVFMIDTAQDILVIATKKLEAHGYMDIAQTLTRVVSQYVEVNALESLIKFNLAIIEHQHFPNDLRVLIRKVKELNQIMVKKKLAIATFEKHQPITQTLEKNESQFSEEVYQKLHFDLMFRPFVKVPEVEPIGQQVVIHPHISTYLNSFEILNEAPMMVNYTKDFYRRYLSLLRPILETNLPMLLAPFSLAMKLSELLQELKTLPNPDKLLIYLDEFEVKELAATAISLKTWADPLKMLGVRFAVSLDDIVVNMNPDVYQFFDYFVVDYRRMVHTDDEQKNAIQFKLIFQNYARFDRPFILLDLPSEGNLEWIPFKHVKIIGADWLMGFQSSLETPTKRQINRIKNVLDKQEKLYGKTN